jgi:UDP:flavonoid glycosyltransferase YjiC (YdhE family)
MVCIPVTNDQPGVAARVVHVGAGELLPLRKVTAARVRDLTRQVLEQPHYRTAAQRIQADIVAAGGAKTAADLVERM